jgi:magnesium and cobalt transporter
MNDDSAESLSAQQRSWLGRLGDLFSSDAKDVSELIEKLRDAQERELIDAEALSMIEGVLQVSEMRVRDVMIPRAQMSVVSRDATPEEALSIVVESGHSRFPVVGEHRDEVVGILLAKDLLRFFADRPDNFNIRREMRPATFIPESKRLNMLLRDFRSSRSHMAIVVDEYGGVSGLITIEDVLEQIVGDIDDEHDEADDDAAILAHSGNRYTIKALTSVEDFNEYFQAELSEEEFDTIGGLVSATLGHLPERGEEVDIDQFRFRILRADNRRVHLLSMQRLEG